MALALVSSDDVNDNQRLWHFGVPLQESSASGDDVGCVYEYMQRRNYTGRVLV
jgi:hypothetical protein